MPPAISLPPEDPRVRLAAERTLLAWIRTSVALMGLGFVVARFGVLEALPHQRDMPLMQGAHGRNHRAGQPLLAPRGHLPAQL